MATLKGFHVGEVINYGWICNYCGYSNPLCQDMLDEKMEHAHCIKCGNMITVSRYLDGEPNEEGEAEHQCP